MTSSRRSFTSFVLSASLLGVVACGAPATVDESESPSLAADVSAKATSADAAGEQVVEAAVSAVAASSPLHKAGFTEFEVDGRLWIFREGGEHVAKYVDGGELPEVHVTRPGAGPDGRTLKSPERDTLVEWLATRPGFATFVVDGRLWVFRADSEELSHFHEAGEPAEQFTRPGAGPGGMTLKGPDRETIEAYLGAS